MRKSTMPMSIPQAIGESGQDDPFVEFEAWCMRAADLALQANREANSW